MTFLILLALLKPFQANSWEVDQFTCRSQVLKDSAPILNAEVNRRLDLAIKHQEKTVSGQPCNLHILHDLQALLANPFVDNLETWAEDNDGIQKCQPSFGSSIYAKAYWNKTLPDGKTPDMNLALMGLKMYGAGLSAVVNINGNYVGLDKISHFMTEGKSFEERLTRGGDVNVLKTYGVPEEMGGYGLKQDGVYSYSDLFANWLGIQFWHNLVSGDNAFFKCQAGQWTRVRAFRFEDYVTEGLDESVNCSRYVNDALTNSIADAIKTVALKNNSSDVKCPADLAACGRLNNYFKKPELKAILVSPACQNQSVVPSTTDSQHTGSENVKVTN